MNILADKKCVPCEGKGQPLTVEQAEKLLAECPGWVLSADHLSISKEYVTKNFIAAVDFIGKISRIAEADNHHPDLHLTNYRKLNIILSTHAIGGLSENDFIIAAKINAVKVDLKK